MYKDLFRGLLRYGGNEASDRSRSCSSEVDGKDEEVLMLQMGEKGGVLVLEQSIEGVAPIFLYSTSVLSPYFSGAAFTSWRVLSEVLGREST